MVITNKERICIGKEIDSMNTRLMEIGCDSVQIIATAQIVGDQFVHFATGAGNIFTRYGAVTNWINEQRDIGTANEIAYAIHEDNGDDE